MTDDELAALAQKIAGSFAEVYAAYCDKVPKPFVVVGMTGALAACANEAGIERSRVVDALNSAFDDIEAGDTQH
jgi:hypothetical protein